MSAGRQLRPRFDVAQQTAGATHMPAARIGPNALAANHVLVKAGVSLHERVDGITYTTASAG